MYLENYIEQFGDPAFSHDKPKSRGKIGLLLEDAYMLVLSGGESFLTIGPIEFGLLFENNLRQSMADMKLGEYYLAREQVARCIMASRIDFYGFAAFGERYSEHEGYIFRIHPNKIDDPEIFDMENSHMLRGLIFDELLVDADQMRDCFNFGPSRSQISNIASNNTSVAESVKTENIPTLLLGRPRKWDWDAILLEVIILANKPDGLPEKQSLLEQWVGQRCLDMFGEEPSISHIRKKVAPIYQKLRSNRL